VIVRDDEHLGAELVAYVVPRGEPLSASALIDALRAALPAYMVPGRYVSLERLPLSPHGKLDRRLLPDPGARRQSARALVAPRTDTERAIAAIWTDVLRVDEVGVEDNFFEIGGHSLVATQVVSRLREREGVEVPIRELFARPTIAALAALVDEQRSRSAAGTAIPSRWEAKLQRAAGQEASLDDLLADIEGLSDAEASAQVGAPATIDASPLTFDQERVFRLEQNNSRGLRYTMSFLLRLRGVLDAGALERAFNTVVARHEVLRSVFREVDGQPSQIVQPPSWITVERTDLGALEPDQRERQMHRDAAAEAHQPFQIDRGPVLRPRLFRYTDDEHVFTVVLHAIVSDDWSLAILVNELAASYDAIVSGREPELPALTAHVADVARWERERWARQAPALRAFWRERLAGVRAVELPTARAARRRRAAPARRRGACRRGCGTRSAGSAPPRW
jgi:acyl carrier protein